MSKKPTLTDLLADYHRCKAEARAAGQRYKARLKAERLATELAMVKALDPHPENGEPSAWDGQLRVTARRVPGSEFSRLVGPGALQPEWTYR